MGLNNVPRLGKRQSKSSVMRAIAKRRVELGYSQIELGQIAGYDQALISSYERGSSTPKINIAEDLAQALGLTIVVCDVATEIDEAVQV